MQVMIRFRLLLLLFFFMLLPKNTIAMSGEIHSAGALEIQAAFLVKFSSYVKWPDTAFSSNNDPIIIGIVGRDPFGSTIDNIARSFKFNGRKIEIRRFPSYESLSKTHILFVSSSEKENISEIEKALVNGSTLLVGNFPGFLQEIGVINFIMDRKKIRFNISRTNCQKENLIISSKLLSVANEIM